MQKTTERTVDQVLEMFYVQPYRSEEVKAELGLSDVRWAFIRREVTKRAAKDGMVFGYHPQLGKHRLVISDHQIALEILEYSFKNLKNGAQTLEFQIQGARAAGIIKADSARKLKRRTDSVVEESSEGVKTIKNLQAKVVRDAQGRFARV